MCINANCYTPGASFGADKVLYFELVTLCCSNALMKLIGMYSLKQ